MMRRGLCLKSIVASVLCMACAVPLQAQDISRDPTVAPGESRSAVPVPPGMEGMAVLVRNNKPFLMVGTRLYAVGDRVGNLRVDRITEKEVWFHDGASQIKVPRFSGIERKVVAETARCAVAPASAASAAAKNQAKRRVPAAKAGTVAQSPAPCEDAQP